MGKTIPWFFGIVLAAGGCESAACDSGLIEVGGQCVDPNATPDCGEPCGAHELCDATTTPNVCKCAPGYDGDPCAWSGVVEDPGFLELEDEMGQTYWRSDGATGATVTRFGEGSVDPGEGLLPASVVCNAGGLLQVVEMPSYGLAEPLVAEITYRTRGVGAFGVGFNRIWRELPETDDEWRTEIFCLGEGAYGSAPNGGPVTIRLSAVEQPPECFGDQSGGIRVDHFRVKPAPAAFCPEPGSVLNGDAEGDDGWVFQTDGDAEAALQDGVGRDGTAGARIFSTTGKAAMTTRLSVPLPSSSGSPALRFQWRGTSGRWFQVGIGTSTGIGEVGRSVEPLQGNNAELNYSYCLPPWVHGGVVDLTFSFIGDGLEGTAELVVDEVEVFRDAICGDSEDLLDPGFESASEHRWLGVYLGGSPNQAVLMRAEGVPPARSGEGVLELTYWDSDADMAMETFVFVPPSAATDAAELVFYSDVPELPRTGVQWLLGRAGSQTADLPKGDGWQCNEVPLPAQWAGRWFRFRVEVGPPVGLGVLIPQQRIFLDDFEISPTGCPSQ